MSTVHADLEAFWTFCLIIVTIPFLLEFGIVGLFDIPAQKLQFCVADLTAAGGWSGEQPAILLGACKLCPSTTARAHKIMGTFAGLMAGLTGL